MRRQPLLVSFNGISFDFALMRALLREEAKQLQADAGYVTEEALALTHLCDQFKCLCAQSYDILVEIWKAYPQDKKVRGLNSLDAIAQANGLEAKKMDGATAPHLWAQGRHAEVIMYNLADVIKTRHLFSMICDERPILRGDGKPITLPLPSEAQCALLNSL